LKHSSILFSAFDEALDWQNADSLSDEERRRTPVPSGYSFSAGKLMLMSL
jgi:hypothetical protein